MRESNFDVLRIVAMVFIVIHHLTLGGLGLYDIQKGIPAGQEGHFLFLGCINLICIIGVNLFFLLSGYFSIHLTIRKLVNILVDLYFYAFVIHLIGVAVGVLPIAKSTLIHFIGSLAVYWFMLVYVLLMLLAPFLNRLCELLSKKEYIAIMGGCLIICCGYGWLNSASSLGLNNGYSLVSAVYLYVIGRGLKKYHFLRRFCVEGYLISILMSTALYGAIVYGTHSGKWSWHVFAYNQPFTFMASLFFIECFGKMKLSKRLGKYVEWAAGSVLAVYYIHSSNWMGGLRNLPVVWMRDSGWVLVGLVLYAIAIFILCIVIDKVRIVLLGNLLDKFEAVVARCAEKYIDRTIMPRVGKIFGI